MTDELRTQGTDRASRYVAKVVDFVISTIDSHLLVTRMLWAPGNGFGAQGVAFPPNGTGPSQLTDARW